MLIIVHSSISRTVNHKIIKALAALNYRTNENLNILKFISLFLSLTFKANCSAFRLMVYK